MGLQGTCGGQQLTFLLDSGASCNFASLDLVKSLGLDYDLCLTQSVRLADKSVVHTCGSVVLNVSFGAFSYAGTFTLLDADVPPILGMSFFREVCPIVDWQQRKVCVKRRGRVFDLKVVKFSNQSVHVALKSWPGAAKRGDTCDLSDDNTFALLAEDANVLSSDDVTRVQLLHDDSALEVAQQSVDLNGSIQIENVQQVAMVDNCGFTSSTDGDTQGGSRLEVVTPLAQPSILPQFPVTSGQSCMHDGSSVQPVRKTCASCAKRFSGKLKYCPKCRNVSFEHLQNQLRDQDGSVVSVDDVDVSNGISNDISNDQ